MSSNTSSNIRGDWRSAIKLLQSLNVLPKNHKGGYGRWTDMLWLRVNSLIKKKRIKLTPEQLKLYDYLQTHYPNMYIAPKSVKNRGYTGNWGSKDLVPRLWNGNKNYDAMFSSTGYYYGVDAKNNYVPLSKERYEREINALVSRANLNPAPTDWNAIAKKYGFKDMNEVKQFQTEYGDYLTVDGKLGGNTLRILKGLKNYDAKVKAGDTEYSQFKTYSDLLAFLKSNNLFVDGIIGRKTRAALNTNNIDSDISNETSNETSNEIGTQVKQELAGQGITPPTIDDFKEPKTITPKYITVTGNKKLSNEARNNFIASGYTGYIYDGKKYLFRNGGLIPKIRRFKTI